MARLRIIKPGFFLDDELASCTPFARLLFAGLWTIADREGRLEDRPQRIRAQILPYDEVDVPGLLAELAEAGFIVRYEAEGRRLITIPSWSRHQRPHPREAASALPACPVMTEAVPEPHLGDDEHSGDLGLGTGDLELGTCNPPTPLPAEPPVDNSVPCSDEQAQEELPQVPAALVATLKRIVGPKRLTAKPGGLRCAGSDLNLSVRRLVALVDSCIEGQLGELTDEERAAARERCRLVAFERIAASHAREPIANLQAYLTAMRQRTWHLGDLVGDELVTELRRKRRRANAVAQ
jgi:hypothetical protein